MIWILPLTGCQTIVTPPPHLTDPVEIYVTDYGRHSTIVLPSPGGGYDEFAFGDWDFLARGDTRWWVAVRALLDSPQATLGRRHVPEQDSPAAMQRALGCKRIRTLWVSKARAAALWDNLDADFRRSPDKPYPSSYSMMEHIPDAEQYWGLHNCNHVTAEWLRRLGCDTDGPALWSDFVVKRPGQEEALGQ